MDKPILFIGIAAIMVAFVSSTFVTNNAITAFAFSTNEPPQQSCSPPGLEHTGTSLNPNCYGTKIPNCVANLEGASACRNLATCTEPFNGNRPFFSTPSCPYN